MALAPGVRFAARALLRPWALLRGTTLGSTEPAAGGGGDGARRFGSQRVLVEPEAASGVAVMKFRNPPVNALSLELLTELVISLEKLENDKTFRGVILTSDCPRVFCAGLDLMEICGRNPAHYAEYWKAMQELWLRTYLSSLVLVAAINAQRHIREHHRAPRLGAGPSAGVALPPGRGPPGGPGGPGGARGPGAEHGALGDGPVAGRSRSRAPADQEHDAKGHRRPPAEAARRRHPELCQLHLQRLHPEVAAGVLGEAPTEERLRAALPARVLAEPTLGGTVALEDSSPVFAHLKLLPVLCFAHLPRRP
ncbi:enoyl-CoA delta isomerase 1, mitochondrial isoform X1 [Bubalus kerabau]|uniref:enoyl-CoA delta isomerase 1, mitochondrial isoform X1 n=1 Tax=Bubalus carabanensis TaxID=3119969 RepID=UPI00244F020F|nr:enoyl-CoA delta isomerase 1, mitochondrial isoform X1 [Bubalus carabanensis]